MKHLLWKGPALKHSKMKIQAIIKNGLLFLGSILYRNHRSKIIFYHDFYIGKGYVAPDCGVVMGTQMDVFKEHLEVFKKEGYKIVPRISSANGEIAIMLDDGFHGVYENRQFFYDNKIYPTIFLAHDLIGRPGFLAENEILELQSHGFIFECHGWTHTSLANKSDEQLSVELGKSKEYLSKILSKEVTELCLPIGYYTDHLLEIIKDYGYTTVYSSIPGNFYEKIHGCLTPRILCQFASPLEVKLFLRGGGEIIKSRYFRLHHLPNYQQYQQ